MKKNQLKPSEIIFTPAHNYRLGYIGNIPYYIQRMSFRKKVKTKNLFNDKIPFHELVIADHMGRAEFENGRPGIALKAICNDIANFTVHKTEIANKSGEYLYLFIHTSIKKPQLYEKNLRKAINREYDTKREIYLINAIEEREIELSDIRIIPDLKPRQKPNIWFDIDNYILFTFGAKGMDRIINALDTTIEKAKAGIDISDSFDSIEN